MKQNTISVFISRSSKVPPILSIKLFPKIFSLSASFTVNGAKKATVCIWCCSGNRLIFGAGFVSSDLMISWGLRLQRCCNLRINCSHCGITQITADYSFDYLHCYKIEEGPLMQWYFKKYQISLIKYVRFLWDTLIGNRWWGCVMISDTVQSDCLLR